LNTRGRKRLGYLVKSILHGGDGGLTGKGENGAEKEVLTELHALS
jgi:hypothetical protein